MRGKCCLFTVLSIQDRKNATTLYLSRPYSCAIKDCPALPTSTTPPVYEIFFDPPRPIISTMTGRKHSVTDIPKYLVLPVDPNYRGTDLFHIEL